MIGRLKNDHDRIRAILDRLDIFLDGAAPPISIEFPRLRWELMRELSVHLAVERTKLPGLSKSHPKLYAQMDLGLDAALSDHVARWTVGAIQDGWQSYRATARALLARLRRRMAFEEQAIFPLLA
jgi:hypothetical protein